MRWWFLLTIALGGCKGLPEVNANVCGNLVLEPGEDCDGFGDGDSTACGNPGSINGCFFVCDLEDLAASPCPRGYGCGADGRCRSPSERFAEAAQVDFPVSEFKVADIDGDGTDDLIGTSQNAFHIAFADGDGSLTTKVFPSPAFAGFFSVGDLNGDAQTDIVAADGLGVAAYLGRPGQTIEPVPFALFETSSLVDVKALSVSGEFGIGPADDTRVLTLLDDPQSGGFIDEDSTNRGSIEALFGAGFVVAAIETPLIGGDNDGDQNEELAITHQGADRVWVVSFDEGLDQSQVGVLQELVLPDSYLANGRAFLADIDGDGDLDITVGMAKPGFVALGQAVNTGSGTFSAITKANLFGTTDFEQPIKLLEVGPLDGDNRADYVLSNGIFRANLINAPDVTGVLAQGSFVAARFVDLNKDGKNDVVTIPDAVPGVEVYLQAETDPIRLNRFALGTSNHFLGNREIIAGDFDGDLIDDVALTARSQATGATLEVLFGSLSGDFTGPVRMGRFDDIIQLQRFSALASVNLVDAIDDLLVVATAQSGGQRTKIASFFRGDSSRAMAAPLLLIEGEGASEIFYLPVQTAIGRVNGAPAIFATSISTRAREVGAARDCANKDGGCGFGWALPAGGGKVTLPAGPEGYLGIDEETLLCYEWAASDLSPSQTDTDELLGVFSTERCGAGAGDAVVFFDFEAQAIATPAVPDGVEGLGKFITGDLDADGLADIVSVFGDFSAGGQGGVVVFWNEGGDFRIDPVATEGIATLAVARGRLNADPFDDLVMLGLSSGAEGGTVEPEVFATLYDNGVYAAPQPFGAFGFGTAIGVADLNRDGLGDLIIGDGAIARVFLAEPAEPRGSQQEDSP